MNPPTNAARSCSPLHDSRDDVIPSHHQSHDKAEQARGTSRNASWQWDIRSDTTVWSEPLFGIIGRENATIPPFREHFCFHTSESWIRLVDATLELLQNGTPYQLRLQMLHADGTRKWVVRNGEAVRNERGDILELRGTVQDFSEGMAEFGNAERDWGTRSSAEDETSRLLQTQEEENAKRASELRDNICQRVALLAAEIQSVSSTAPDLSAEAQAQLGSLWQETTEILAELHRVSDRLYPLILDLLGLSSAMRSLCRKFMSEHGIAVEYSCTDVPANRLNKQSRLVLYRTLEQILASIASHSSANNVTVGLDHGSAELRLRVSDNGVGFEQANAKTVAGLGLARIKAQIEQIGGSLAVETQPACGTLIEARTPLTSASEGAPS
jgi:signal transduction histidine kinase